MAMAYFCAYHSMLDAIEPLSFEERGRLFTACLEYSRDGVLIEMTGNERYVFPALRSQLERDEDKYLTKCAKNKRAAEMRWQALVYNR